MTTFFETAWNGTGRSEGEYSDHPSDSGGPTRWGVTERLARKYGYRGDMRVYPKAEATRVAKIEFWDVMRLDEIAALSQHVAFELFDTGFLCGQETASKFLQEALSALNRQGKDYPDLVIDGSIGPTSINALRAYLMKRGNDGILVLMRVLNAQQAEYLRRLVKARPKDEDFFYGWVLNRVVI